MIDEEDEIIDESIIEPGEYQIQMEIDRDRKGFYVEIRSGMEMSDDEIILAFEEWLYNNLLDGYDPQVPKQ